MLAACGLQQSPSWVLPMANLSPWVSHAQSLVDVGGSVLCLCFRFGTILKGIPAPALLVGAEDAVVGTALLELLSWPVLLPDILL